MTVQTTTPPPASGRDRLLLDRAPTPAGGGRERMQRAGSRLWRVVNASGHVIGHLESVDDPLGERFRAKRYHAPSTRFRVLGEFWSADDAVACLRYSG